MRYRGVLKILEVMLPYDFTDLPDLVRFSLRAERLEVDDFIHVFLGEDVMASSNAQVKA